MAELPEIVSRGVERFGDAPAIRCSDGEMSFAALETRVSQAAQAFRARGLEPGDRAAMLLSAGPEHIAVVLAALRAGIVACPLSDRLPAEAISEQANLLGAKLLVTDSNIATQVPRVSPYELFDAHPVAFKALRLASRQRAVFLFTSGSTGAPKPAGLTYGNLFYNAVYANQNIDVGSGKTWLLSLPLYHVGGLGIVFRCLLDGGTIAIPDPGEPLEQAIARYNVTHVSVVATQLRRLLNGGAGLSRLQCILVGGGPVPAELVQEAIRRRLPLFTTYGMTEMASQITTTAPNDAPDRLSTSGKPLLKDTIRISQSGEIEVTGETLFEGYLDPKSPFEGGAGGCTLQRPLTRDFWFRTGDLGRFDELGYLHVTGRKDNQFISGGENIQPEEIEQALSNIEGVERAIVVPVDHPEWGKRPVAFIEWNGSAKSEAEVREALAKTLPKFKIPDAFHSWPKDSAESLKTSRTHLAALAKASLQ